jgi:hypothetical protein
VHSHSGEARFNECICGGRAIPGWEDILRLNNHNVSDYKDEIYQMFMVQGGGGLNHFYQGVNR